MKSHPLKSRNSFKEEITVRNIPVLIIKLVGSAFLNLKEN